MFFETFHYSFFFYRKHEAYNHKEMLELVKDQKT